MSLVDDKTINAFSELLAGIASWLDWALTSIWNALGWFFQTISHQIDNREIATLVVIAALFLFAIVKGDKKSILKSFLSVIQSVLTPKLIVPALFLIVNSVFIFALAESLNLWTGKILLDTILEVLFIGIPSMAIAVNSKTVTSIARQFILPEIGLGAFAAFYINIECFPILIEIVLQSLIFFFSIMQAFGRTSKDGMAVSQLSGCFLGLIIIGIAIVSTYQLITIHNTVDWSTELESLLMTIYYPILMLPFVVLLGYYAAYETLNTRIKMNSTPMTISSKIYLFFRLLPRLIDISHFRYNQILKYKRCITKKERDGFLKQYKRQINNDASAANKKLERMKAGLEKTGFDQDGIWLDWDNIEKIKAELWCVASIQNRNWTDDQSYDPDMQTKYMEVFTPRECTGGSFVSQDCKTYICWMSNRTGFTLGVGSTDGVFPPLKYEGDRPPVINTQYPLDCFFRDENAEALPNWAFDFHTDDSYK